MLLPIQNVIPHVRLEIPPGVNLVAHVYHQHGFVYIQHLVIQEGVNLTCEQHDGSFVL